MYRILAAHRLNERTHEAGEDRRANACNDRLCDLGAERARVNEVIENAVTFCSFRDRQASSLVQVRVKAAGENSTPNSSHQITTLLYSATFVPAGTG